MRTQSSIFQHSDHDGVYANANGLSIENQFDRIRKLSTYPLIQIKQ